VSQPARPEALTWTLVSQKGWAEIDYDQLPRRTWIPCMPIFPEGENRESWAATCADVWWSGHPHEEADVTQLAALLSAFHQDIYAAGHCHMAVIHLPDPAILPLPVQLGVWAMHGEREQMLRTLAHAYEPEAVERPIVEDFTTEQLGTGLKSLHYRQEPGPDGEEELHGYLNYAWRIEKYETDLRLFTFDRDLGRLQRALPDIDNLARAISIVPRPQ